MGLYLKLLPGVRIRISGRGVRASVGPRIARVHVGAGGTGVSTGAGPVSLYQGLTPRGHKAKKTTQRAGVRSTAPDESFAQPSRSTDAPYRRPVPSSIDAQAQEFAQLLYSYAATPRPNALMPPGPPPVLARSTVAARARRDARRGVRWWSVVAQGRALGEARRRTPERYDQELRQLHRAHEEASTAEEATWSALLANDSAAVVTAINDAFSAQNVPALCTDASSVQASTLVQVPELTVVPVWAPSETPTGRPSFRRLNKTERNQGYCQLTCGHLLLAARHALAAAPHLPAVRVAALRNSPPDAYGVPRAECIAIATFMRTRLDNVQWSVADAESIARDTASPLTFHRSGVAREVIALDLSGEPKLAAAIAQAVGMNGESAT